MAKKPVSAGRATSEPLRDKFTLGAREKAFIDRAVSEPNLELIIDAGLPGQTMRLRLQDRTMCVAFLDRGLPRLMAILQELLPRRNERFAKL